MPDTPTTTAAGHRDSTRGPAKLKRRKKKNAGWVPNQHGAWAMLIVPFIIGVALAIQNDRFGWYTVPLFAFWMLGYFCFHASSLWLKSRRAKRFVRPVVTYAVLAGAAGIITWLLAGWPLVLWVIPYAPILAFALFLAAARHERDLIGGLLTEVAACLILLVASHPDPRDALGDGTGQILAALCFAYFAGTVWVVKTMIRERGKPGWIIASVGWHLLATAGCAIAATLGTMSWAWPIFFGATTVRAAFLPLNWPMRGRPLSAAKVGVTEIFFSSALLIIALTIGVR